MVKIFGQLQYDFGVLTSHTATRLRNGPLPNWQVFPEKVIAKPLRTNFGKILLIVLPELRQQAELETHLPAIDALAQEGLQDSAIRLVLAFSPWGEVLEKTYLKKAKYPPHILLGSNSGSAVKRLYANNRTLWVRPGSKGKDMQKIQIYQFPLPGTQKKWAKQAVRVHSVSLDDTIPANQKVLELIIKSR